MLAGGNSARLLAAHSDFCAAQLGRSCFDTPRTYAGRLITHSGSLCRMSPLSPQTAGGTTVKLTDVAERSNASETASNATPSVALSSHLSFVWRDGSF